jgi:hypothetical protein
MTVQAAASEKSCGAGSSCTVSGTENQTLSASCSTGTITVSTATYGVNSKTESCLKYASSQCNGKSSCSPIFSNSNCAGDPDSVKAGSASISCSSEASAPAPGFSPPGRVVLVSSCNGNASNDTSVVASAGAAAGAGNTVQFANGQTCVLSTLTLTPGVYYYVPKGQTGTWKASSVGQKIKFSNNVTLNGIATCNEYFNLVSTSGVTIGNSNIGSFSCGSDRMLADHASALTLINNNLSYFAGLSGWYPSNVNIDGNHFDVCKPNDCFGFADGFGRKSYIQRNIFQHYYLAVMEIGFGQTTDSTVGLVVNDNWANESMTPSATMSNGYNYQIAYSIPLNGSGSTGTMISNNYADGTTPSGSSNICIEISGGGTVENNQCNNFTRGVEAYSYNGKCGGGLETIMNNNMSNSPFPVGNYAKCSSTYVQSSGTTTALKAVPPQPTRISWGGQN